MNGEINEAVAELHSYQGTIFQEAADYARAVVLNTTNAEYVLNLFEVYEAIADRFNEETGYLPYVDYGIKGSKFDLILGAYHAGYGSVEMSKLVHFADVDSSKFRTCYNEWYHYVVDLNLLKYMKTSLKDTLQRNRGASFDECIDDMIDVLARGTRSEITDEAILRSWLRGKLLATYRRNR